MNPQIEFWFEYGSTYTYLTVARMERAAAFAGVEVAWRPFLLAPIFAKAGLPQGPFLPFPAKIRYMWRDIERRAKQHGLPYRKPSTYPPSTLLTARVGVIAAREGWCADYTRAVFERHWTQDVAIGSRENLRDSIEKAGRGADDVIARAESPANKAALREQTEEAEMRGIFGSPSFVARGELYWGDDRLEEAIAHSVQCR